MLALIAVALAPQWTSQSQQSEATAPRTLVVLPSAWEPRTKYSLELVIAREDYQGDKVVKFGESSTDIQVEILSKRDDGYVCRWTYGKTKILEGAGKGDPVLERLAAMNEGYALDMLLDATGSVVGLVDVEESKRRMDAIIDELKRTFVEQGAPKSQLDPIFDQVAATMKGPAFSALMLNHPTVLYAWCGGEFELGQTTEFEAQLPNPLGGEALPAKGEFRLSELDAKDNEAVLEVHQVIDPDKGAESIRAGMSALAAKLGKPGPEAQDLPSIAIEDSATYAFDLVSGLPRALEWTRSSTVGDRKRVDYLSIDVTLPAVK